MGHTNSKTNIVDATNQVTQEVYNSLSNTLDVEATLNITVNQGINITSLPECKNIKVVNANFSEGSIMQTSTANTLNALSSAMNSKFDANINQLNQDGIDSLLGIFGVAQKDTNKITTANIIKNKVHNSVCNAVTSTSRLSTTINQEINLNPAVGGKGDRWSQNFSCDSALFENFNCSKAQIGQIALSAVKNVAGIDTISDDTIKAAQTNTGFLGDLVSSFKSLLSRIMYVVMVIAIVGLIVTAIGGLIYFATRPSHPKSADSLLDGISNSLSSET